MKKTHTLWLFCAFVLVAAPPHAAGAPLPKPLRVLHVTEAGGQVDEARRWNEEGIALIEQGQVERASALFRQSFEAYPAPSTLYNLAVAQEELGEYADAVCLYVAFRDAMTAVRQALQAERNNPARPRPLAAVDTDLATVEQNLRDAETFIATIRAQLAPRMVLVEFQIEPATARVFANGAELVPAVEGVSEMWLWPGAYTLTAEAEGHAPARKQVDLAPGPVFRWSARLPPLAPEPTARGALDVTSNVPGATAFISGQQVGTTPLTGYQVDPGFHDVRIEADGHQPFTTRVQVATGSTVRVEARLAPEESGWTQSDTGWTLVGAGAGVAVTGAVLLGTALAAANDANSANDSNQFRRARTQHGVGWGLVGAGAAAAITGTVLLILDDTSDGDGPAFGAGPLGDGGWIGATWRF